MPTRTFSPEGVHPAHVQMMDAVAQYTDGMAVQYGYCSEYETNAQNLDLVTYVPLGEPKGGVTINVYTIQQFMSLKYVGSSDKLYDDCYNARNRTLEGPHAGIEKFMSDYEFQVAGDLRYYNLDSVGGSRRGRRNHLRRSN